VTSGVGEVDLKNRSAASGYTGRGAGLVVGGPPYGGCMTPEEWPIAPEPGAGFAASGMVAALEQLSVDVAPVSCAPTLTLSDSELRQGLARAAALVAQVHAAYLHLVAALDARPDAVPGAATGRTAVTYWSTPPAETPWHAWAACPRACSRTSTRTASAGSSESMRS